MFDIEKLLFLLTNFAELRSDYKQLISASRQL